MANSLNIKRYNPGCAAGSSPVIVVDSEDVVVVDVVDVDVVSLVLGVVLELVCVVVGVIRTVVDREVDGILKVPLFDGMLVVDMVVFSVVCVAVAVVVIFVVVGSSVDDVVVVDSVWGVVLEATIVVVDVDGDASVVVAVLVIFVVVGSAVDVAVVDGSVWNGVEEAIVVVVAADDTVVDIRDDVDWPPVDEIADVVDSCDVFGDVAATVVDSVSGCWVVSGEGAGLFATTTLASSSDSC